MTAIDAFEARMAGALRSLPCRMGRYDIAAGAMTPMKKGMVSCGSSDALLGGRTLGQVAGIRGRNAMKGRQACYDL